MSELIPLFRSLLHPEGLPPSFSALDARHVAAAILDGGVDDFELGALTAALARHARQPAVVLGLKDAVAERMHCLAIASNGPARPVVLPNFSCTQGGMIMAPVLPVLALLLQRLGVPVLISGALETTGGLAVTTVLREFAVLPCATRAQAELCLSKGQIALLPLTLVAPAMAAMMTQKARLGVETPAHVLAPLLQPLAGDVAQCIACPATELELLEATSGDARTLLRVETDAGVPFGAVGARTLLKQRDEATWQLLFAADPASRELPPGAPRALCEWTRQLISGKVALPATVAHLLAASLLASGYARDIHEAKAITAVEATSLAAA